MNIQTDRIRKRYNRVAKIYDLLEGPMEKMALGRWRKPIFESLKGKVLEIGVGTGKNIEYYHDDIEVTAIDFSPNMLKKAGEKVQKLGAKVELKEMDAQKMDLPDNSFDYVVATCVFCSIPDPIKGFKEVKRVLKPGGKVILIEHVRSEKKVVGLLMDLMNPLTVNLYGANINRRTEENVKIAGFKNVKITNLWNDIVKKIEITKENHQ
ncbi:phosphatidylethanolamine N-methyltransferase PmtA [Clostridium aceticum]|uniref:Phosphatidylethanolamine N-methyltransferase PmtA n=1 Tax=Clostridium aceticum TaxID=84022 RepID=A0A0D8IEB6_9CLOT|nr:class I SAM-dependent methyltransferase [Clostridium aceticum]AKL93989.1 phosphatidylethanolamine N-methyltransferase PmtA [Clostridium aceticum]KJF28628.1 methyltransferase type 11 [Clostridium aceticum]